MKKCRDFQENTKGKSEKNFHNPATQTHGTVPTEKFGAFWNPWEN